ERSSAPIPPARSWQVELTRFFPGEAEEGCLLFISILHQPTLRLFLREGESKAGAKLTGREKMAQDFGRPLLRVPGQELKKKPGWQKERSRQPVSRKTQGWQKQLESKKPLEWPKPRRWPTAEVRWRPLEKSRLSEWVKPPFCGPRFQEPRLDAACSAWPLVRSAAA
ncbi:MAG: hypothetical protein QOG92_1601, partial [Verrucomicrobiota bacterium]|nr:hypothetical protein [Verrucomicrobiota bacterium]